MASITLSRLEGITVENLTEQLDIIIRELAKASPEDISHFQSVLNQYQPGRVGRDSLVTILDFLKARYSSNQSVRNSLKQSAEKKNTTNIHPQKEKLSQSTEKRSFVWKCLTSVKQSVKYFMREEGQLKEKLKDQIQKEKFLKEQEAQELNSEKFQMEYETKVVEGKKNK